MESATKSTTLIVVCKNVLLEFYLIYPLYFRRNSGVTGWWYNRLKFIWRHSLNTSIERFLDSSSQRTISFRLICNYSNKKRSVKGFHCLSFFSSMWEFYCWWDLPIIYMNECNVILMCVTTMILFNEMYINFIL